jgi:hypothetical protein
MPCRAPRSPSLSTLRAVSDDDPSGYVLFVPSPQGYRLEERSGTPPERDERIEVAGAAFVVSRVGASPLPQDPRPCAYLLSC